MLKQREFALEKSSILAQSLMTMGCFLVAWWLSHHWVSPLTENVKEYKVIALLILPIWYGLLSWFDLGRMLRVKMYSVLLIEYLSVVLLGMALLMAAIVILDFHTLSRWVLMLFAGINFVVLLGYKYTVFRTMKFFRGKGYNTRSLLILADEDSEFFIDRLLEIRDWGYSLWAIMSDSLRIKARYGDRFVVLPQIEEVAQLLDGKRIDEVMYCKGRLDQKEIRNLIYACAEVGVVFRVHSEFLGLLNAPSKLHYISQVPFLTYMNTPANYLALKVKALFDYVLSVLLLTAISPLMLGIALAIKLGDGGPVFFRQKRVGLNGRRFYCLKFRTMVVDAEALKDDLMSQNEQEGPVFKMRHDPRVTRIGAFLRKTSLDELPQFFNVLRGEMSIVGPRPPVPDEVKEYERWQRRRLSMKPGLTCIWQVSGRNNIPFDQWMKMDLQYIDTWSLKHDLILILKTVKVMVRGEGQ